MRHTASLVSFLSFGFGLGGCGGGGNDPPPGGANPDARVTVTPDAAPPDATTADAREIAIDITTVHVSGVVTANGVVPDSTCAGDELRATVYFYQEDGAGNFGLPVPCAAAGTPFTFEGDVFPGTYRVQVAGGVSSLPTSGINVAAGLDLHADRGGLAFDITNRHVSGTITQNGQPPTETNCPIGLNRGQVHLQEISNGDFFSLPVPCAASSGTPFVFSGTLPPGIYKVSVLGENSSLLGGTHVVDTALSVQSDVDNLSYNLVTHHVSGTITVNGGVPGQDASCRGGRAVVTFSTLTPLGQGSTSLDVPCAAAGTPFTFSGEVLAGPQIVTAAGRDSDLPRAQWPHGTVNVIGDIQNMTIAVQTVPLAGSVTINGAVPPACTGDPWGEVAAYEIDHGYDFPVVVPCGASFAFATNVYPGTYFISAEINAAAPITLTRALAVTVPTTGLALDSAVTEHPVSGVVTLNGRIPDGACADPDMRGRVNLDDLTTGAGVSLPIPCGSGPATFSGTLPPGVYRVSIVGDRSDLPGLGYIAPQPLTVSGPTTGLVFDVPTRRVTGTITVGGHDPTCGPGALAANVNFIHATTHVTFAFQARCGTPVDWEGEVFPGTYEVVVYGVASNVPETGFRAAAALAIP